MTPTITPTNANRLSNCPAGAYQAVTQAERGKMQHSYAENAIAAAYGITRTTAPCTLTGDDLADARYAADTALRMLDDASTRNVAIETPLTIAGTSSRTIRADVTAEIGSVVAMIDFKFTTTPVVATDPQMLMTAAGVWTQKRRAGETPDGLRIAVIDGKNRRTSTTYIPAEAMTWITDDLVASWITNACDASPAVHCPTWCIGCQRRYTCSDYQTLRDAILHDESREMHQAMYEAMSAVVQAVTEGYTTWSHTPADEPEPEASSMDPEYIYMCGYPRYRRKDLTWEEMEDW